MYNNFYSNIDGSSVADNNNKNKHYLYQHKHYLYQPYVTCVTSPTTVGHKVYIFIYICHILYIMYIYNIFYYIECIN